MKYQTVAIGLALLIGLTGCDPIEETSATAIEGQRTVVCLTIAQHPRLMANGMHARFTVQCPEPLKVSWSGRIYRCTEAPEANTHGWWIANGTCDIKAYNDGVEKVVALKKYHLWVPDLKESGAKGRGFWFSEIDNNAGAAVQSPLFFGGTR